MSRMAIRYLTFEEILAFHDDCLEPNEPIDLLNAGYIASTLYFMRHHVAIGDRKQNAIEKGAILFRDIILNHPFMDGNKRTGAICLLTFLDYNGFYLEIQDEEIELFTVETAQGKHSLENIKDFIEKYIKDVYKNNIKSVRHGKKKNKCGRGSKKKRKSKPRPH
jgi:death-on-curing protein